jgi:hypothetical protein
MVGSYSNQTLQAIQGVFDFVTCQRSDGSFYGNQGSSCHKGRETKIPVNVPLSKRVSDFLNRNTKAIRELFNRETETIATAVNEFDRLKNEYLQKIADGNLSFEEVEKYILEGEEFDVSKANFVLIGQEPKVSPEYDAASHMASTLATQRMIESGFVPSEAHDARRIYEQGPDVGSTRFRPNSYVAIATNVGRLAAGENETKSSNEIIGGFFGGRTLASVEMATVPAWSTMFGNNDKVIDKAKGITGLDPVYSGYGLFARQRDPRVAQLTRREVEKNYADQRATIVQGILVNAAKNSTFKGAMAVPGSGGKYQTFQENVLNKFWNGKYGEESNIRQVAIPLSTTAGAKTKDIVSHIVDLGNGKFFTSHGITLVTQGYQSGAKINELRTKALSSWMDGSAKPYTPNSK